MDKQNHFQKAFNRTTDALSEQTGAIAVTPASDEYISKLENVIKAGTEKISQRAGTEQSLGIRTGFVSEQYHNLDAKLKSLRDSEEYTVETLGSTERDSPDIKITTQDGTEYLYQVKYHSTPEGTFNSLIDHNYSGMKILVPWGQKTELTDLINKKLADPNTDPSDFSKLIEYRGNLVTKIGEHGVSHSKMQEITQDAEKDKFTNIKSTELNSTDGIHILENTLEAGFQAGIIGGVISTAPVLFSEIKKSLSGGDFNGEKIFNAALTGVKKSSIKGVVSAAAYNACRAGLLGESLKNADPTGVAAITVVSLRAIDNSIKLIRGEIQLEQFVGQTIKDSIIATASYIGATTIQTLIPIPIVGAAIGSLIGGLIAGAACDFFINLFHCNNWVIPVPSLKPAILQNYKLPDEVMYYIGKELIKKDKIEKDKVSKDRAIKDGIRKETITRPVMRRGLITLNTEGYIIINLKGQI